MDSAKNEGIVVRIFEGWTSEQVTHLATDIAVAQAGQQLAQLDGSHWQVLASDSTLGWAIFQAPNTRPYRLTVHLEKLKDGACLWNCTCEQVHTPCQHVLGMLYILVERPHYVRLEHTPPNWTNGTHAETSPTPPDTTTTDQIIEYKLRLRKRTSTIQNGISELEQWLINIIRRGLADPQIQSYAFWDSRASRMVDAQAPGIASWLYRMGSLPAQGQDWIEPMLDQLGRLYLLIERFKRFDHLSAEVQADLRMVVGWYLKRDELIYYNTQAQEDEWVVIGRYSGEMNDYRASQKSTQRSLRTQRIWLRGVNSGKDALILEFAFGANRFDTRLMVGQAIQANLSFYPSRYPLRAFITKRYGIPFDGDVIMGSSILDNIERYAKALTRNPWIQNYPFFLADVIPVEHEGTWVVRDLDGAYLPVSEHFVHNWHLLAVSGEYPLQIAGEWDGRVLLPTGAQFAERYIDFEIIPQI